MTQNINNKQTQNIINTYRSIHTIIFSYGGAILSILIAATIITGLIMRNTVNATQINELEVPTQIQQTLTDSNMKIIVQQSNVIQDNKRINSQDNILSYKDIILPSIVSLPENSELSALTDFDQADYAIQDLLSTINQLFFHQSNPNININNREKAPGLNLSNDVTLQEFFSLKCIDNYKFTNAICNNYITTFINSFIYYDLSFPFHQNELATIVNSLNKDQKIMACDNLIIYTQKTYNTSTTLNNIIKKNCERDHIQEYEILSQLIEVNKEIHTGFKNTYYKNDDVNIYKLRSIQQAIYDDIKSGKLFLTTIEQYTAFMEQLLQKTTLDQLTNDSSYYINTYIINKALENKTLTSGIENKYIIQAKEKLDELNKGSLLYGYDGLVDNIKNNQLYQISTATIEDAEQVNQQPQVNIQEFLRTPMYREVNTQQITDTSWTSEGYFLIDNETDQRLYVKLFISYIYEQLTVTSIQATQIVTPITATINKIIESQETISLLEIESFITTNKDLLQTLPDIDICDVLQEELRQNIISCNDKQIVLQNTITVENEDETQEDTIYEFIYTINHNNFIPTSMVINDQIIQQYAQQIINTNPINESNILVFIQDIIELTPETIPDTTQEAEIDDAVVSQKILVIERFQNYLDITPDKVGQRGDSFVIQFVANDVDFIAGYDITTHTITPLVLTDVIINNKNLAITNFRLTLGESTQRQIEEFKKDPRDYIRRFYPAIDSIYEEFSLTDEDKTETN